jgi:hypothetical protein
VGRRARAACYTTGMRGDHPGDVLEELFQAAVCVHRPGGAGDPHRETPAPTDPLAARMANHARAVRARGGTPLAALDAALVTMLFAGEVAGVRHDQGGDPAGVQPLARSWAGYPQRLRRELDAGQWPVNPRRNLQLMITRRCQLRCEYCPVVKSERDLPRSAIAGAVDLLLTAGGPRVRLDLSGGEPLLRPDAVRFAVERLRAGAEARGIEAALYMVTNGFELGPALARELAGHDFEIELSMDGPEALHNRWKTPLDPSENPYRRTLAALHNVLAADGRHRVVMVATPENVDQLPASFAHVVAQGAQAVDVNYAVGRRWQGAPLRAYLGGMAQIIDAHGGAIRSGALRLGNLASRNEPSVLNGEWMVDTDGAIHLMTEWALERWRPADAPDCAVARLGEIERWDDLAGGRFHAYLTLLQTYGWRDRELRATLLDSVITGREVARALATAVPEDA